MNVRRILGIDPGLRITGFGLIVCVGGKLTYVTSGCIRSDADGSLPSRIGMILRDLSSVIAAHQPTEVAVEKVFVNVNPNSTLLLGQARGAAISAA
ncbi:MAG: crossover junction endodeoxyribonuclease RuvC, partial [Betaproteobacteria bacterium]